MQVLIQYTKSSWLGVGVGSQIGYHFFFFSHFFFTFNRPEWVQIEGPQRQNRAGPQRGIRKGPAGRPTTRKVPLNCGMF